MYFLNKVVLQFSKDFQLVKHGTIIKSLVCNNNHHNHNHNHNHNDQQQSSSSSSSSCIENYQYPLDGKWRVQWIHRRDHNSREDVEFTHSQAQIKIAFNQFTLYGTTYKICLGNNNCDGDGDGDDDSNSNGVYFDWPLGYRQVAESGLDLR